MNKKKKPSIRSMQEDIEIHLAMGCKRRGEHAERMGEEFECLCPDPFEWSSSEVTEFWKKYIEPEKPDMV